MLMRLNLYIWTILLLSCVTAKSQPPSPSGLPAPYSTGYYRIGWVQWDSGSISTSRQPNFVPKYAGTEVFWLNPGVDSSKWLWTGAIWIKEAKVGAPTILVGVSPIVVHGDSISCPTCGSGSGGISQLTADGTAGPGAGSQPFTLATVNTNVGSFGDASHVAEFTANGKGLITVAGQVPIQIAESQVTNLVSDLSGKQATITLGSTSQYFRGDLSLATFPTNLSAFTNGPGYITGITGIAAGGALAGTYPNPTLAAVVSAGTCTNCALTYNAAGQITVASSGSGGGALTGGGGLSPLFTNGVSGSTLTFTQVNAPANSVLSNPNGTSGAYSFNVPTITTLNGWAGTPLVTGTGVSGSIPYWQTSSKLGSTGMVNDTTNKRINFVPSIFVQGSGLSPDGTPVGITTYSRPDTVLPHGYSEGIQEYSFVTADSLFYAYIGVQSWPYVLGNTAGPLHGKFPGYVNGFSSGPLWDGSLGNGNKNLPVLLGYFSALNSQNGSVTNAYDYYASELNSVNSTSNHGNFTNHYAFYAEAMDSATHNYGLYITHADSNYMWGNLKLPSLVQRIIDTSNLKVLVGDNLGNVFKMYWPTAGAQTLTYTQLALNNTLSISGGNTQTFLTATHSLAGLMDTASKAVVDSLKARTYTWPTFNIFAVQGISPIGNSLDSFALGGSGSPFFRADTIVTAGFAFSITGLPSKATALSTDSVLIENVAGQIFKLPVPSGGGGAVSSVSNSDGTLTISPTTGTVVASLNLGNANTWTANQSFPTINLSGNIVFTGTTATSTVGSLSDIAAKVFTRGVSSDGDLTNSAGTGARVRDQINGVDKFDILSTGQLQVPAGYGTSFGGATSDSVLTIVGGNIRVLAISSLPSGGGGGGIGVDSVQTDTTSVNTTLTQTTGYNEIIVNPSSTISSLTLTTATVFHSSNDLYIRFGAPGGNIAQGNPVVTAFFLSAGSGLTLWGNFNPSGQTYNSGDLLRIHKIGGTLYFTHN